MFKEKDIVLILPSIIDEIKERGWYGSVCKDWVNRITNIKDCISVSPKVEKRYRTELLTNTQHPIRSNFNIREQKLLRLETVSFLCTDCISLVTFNLEPNHIYYLLNIKEENGFNILWDSITSKGTAIQSFYLKNMIRKKVLLPIKSSVPLKKWKIVENIAIL